MFLYFPHQNRHFSDESGPSKAPNDQAATTPQKFTLRFQALGLGEGASHEFGPNQKIGSWWITQIQIDEMWIQMGEFQKIKSSNLQFLGEL